MSIHFCVLIVLFGQASGSQSPAGVLYASTGSTAEVSETATASLQQAIATAATLGAGRIVIVGDAYEFRTEGLHTEGNVTVDLNDHCWEPAAAISIRAGHLLNVQNGKVRPRSFLQTYINIASGASLLVNNATFEGWKSTIFSLSGTLVCTQCRFAGNMEGVVDITEAGGKLEIADSLIQNNSANIGLVFRVLSLDEDASLSINITNTVVLNNSAVSGGSLGFISADTLAQVGSRSVLISACELTSNSGTLIVASAESTSLNISQSKILNCEQAFALSLSSSTFYVANTLISGSSITTVHVAYLHGTIVFAGVNITGVSSGPAIMLMNTFRDVAKAVVVLTDTRISNVNSAAMSAGALYASGFTLLISTLEISNIKCSVACGFALVGSSLSLEHITIRNVTGWVFAFGQIIGSTGSLRDIELYSAKVLGVYVFEQSFCTLSISSLSMHDMTPTIYRPTTSSYNMVVIHQFFSTIEFSNVKIEFPPLLIVAALASVSSEIRFTGLVCPQFAAVQGYTVIMSNVTVQQFKLSSPKMQNFFQVIGGTLKVDNLRIEDGVFSKGMFTLQQSASLNCQQLIVKNVRAWSVVQAFNSIVNIASVVISNSSFESFAENILNA